MKRMSCLSFTVEGSVLRSQKKPSPMNSNYWQGRLSARSLDFQVNLDNTMKQRYASQLYDRSNASIAKALLLQMPSVSFTQYSNELNEE